MQPTNLPRAISYVRGNRRVHGRWTDGWSNPVHWVDGRPFVYWTTENTGTAIVDLFVGVY